MRRLKVFYVDDEPDLCSVFRELFASDDVDVRTFSRPEDLVNAAGAERPDVLFIDYRMPSMNGDDLVERLDASVPRYLISGDLDIQTRNRFAGQFTKPFDIEAIRSVIHSHRK